MNKSKAKVDKNLNTKLQFEVQGKNFENLLNTLKYRNINIEKCIFLSNDKIRFQTLQIYSPKIIDLLKNSCYNFVVNEVQDLNYFVSMTLKHFGFIFALVLFGVCACIYPNFLWNVQILSDDISQTQIQTILSQNDIKIGSKLSSIDTSMLEDSILSRCDTTSQVSVSIYGSKLVVNVKKSIDNSKLDSHYMPILSKHFGTIQSLNLKSGTALVGVGDYVKNGDKLVEPYSVDFDGTKKICIADADIEILAYNQSSIFYDENGTSLQRSGNSYSVNCIFGQNPPQCKYQNYETQTTEFSISDLLPIKVYRTTYFELTQKQNTLKFDEIKDELIAKCEKSINILDDAKIIDKIINITPLNNGAYSIMVTIKTLEKL